MQMIGARSFATVKDFAQFYKNEQPAGGGGDDDDTSRRAAALASLRELLSRNFRFQIIWLMLVLAVLIAASLLLRNDPSSFNKTIFGAGGAMTLLLTLLMKTWREYNRTTIVLILMEDLSPKKFEDILKILAKKL